MEVAAREALAGDGARLLEQVAHRARAGEADGVGDADAVDAGVEQRLQAAQHLARLHLALDRAAKRSADAAFDQRLRARRIARRAHAADLGDHFVGRLAQVGEAVRMACRKRHQHDVGAAVEGALRALEVRHQHRDDQIGQGLRELDQLRGVGELRQQPCGNERAHLDLALAGGVGGANPGLLALGRQHRANALQAVAQADFADDGAIGEARHGGGLQVGCRSKRRHRPHSRRSANSPGGIWESPRFRNGSAAGDHARGPRVNPTWNRAPNRHRCNPKRTGPRADYIERPALWGKHVR